MSLSATAGTTSTSSSCLLNNRSWNQASGIKNHQSGIDSRSSNDHPTHPRRSAGYHLSWCVQLGGRWQNEKPDARCKYDYKPLVYDYLQCHSVRKWNDSFSINMNTEALSTFSDIVARFAISQLGVPYVCCASAKRAISLCHDVLMMALHAGMLLYSPNLPSDFLAG